MPLSDLVTTNKTAEKRKGLPALTTFLDSVSKAQPNLYDTTPAAPMIQESTAFRDLPAQTEAATARLQQDQRIRETQQVLKTTTGRDFSPEQAAQMAPGIAAPDEQPRIWDVGNIKRELSAIRSNPKKAGETALFSFLNGMTAGRLTQIFGALDKADQKLMGSLVEGGKAAGFLHPTTGAPETPPSDAAGYVQERLEGREFPALKGVSEFGGATVPISAIESAVAKPLVGAVMRPIAQPASRLGRVGMAAAERGAGGFLTGGVYGAAAPGATLESVLGEAAMFGGLAGAGGALGAAVPRRMAKGPFMEPVKEPTPKAPAPAPEAPPPAPTAAPQPKPAYFAPQYKVKQVERKANQALFDVLPEETPVDVPELRRQRSEIVRSLETEDLSPQMREYAQNAVKNLDDEIVAAGKTIEPTAEEVAAEARAAMAEGGAALEQRAVEPRRKEALPVPVERRMAERRTAVGEAAKVVAEAPQGPAKLLEAQIRERKAIEQVQKKAAPEVSMRRPDLAELPDDQLMIRVRAAQRTVDQQVAKGNFPAKTDAVNLEAEAMSRGLLKPEEAKFPGEVAKMRETLEAAVQERVPKRPTAVPAAKAPEISQPAPPRKPISAEKMAVEEQASAEIRAAGPAREMETIRAKAQNLPAKEVERLGEQVKEKTPRDQKLSDEEGQAIADALGVHYGGKEDYWDQRVNAGLPTGKVARNMYTFREDAAGTNGNFSAVNLEDAMYQLRRIYETFNVPMEQRKGLMPREAPAGPAPGVPRETAGAKAEMPPSIQEYVKKSGADPAEVQILQNPTPEQLSELRSKYGLPNAVSPTGETIDTFGKRGWSAYVDDEAGGKVVAIVQGEPPRSFTLNKVAVDYAEDRLKALQNVPAEKWTESDLNYLRVHGQSMLVSGSPAISRNGDKLIETVFKEAERRGYEWPATAEARQDAAAGPTAAKAPAAPAIKQSIEAVEKKAGAKPAVRAQAEAEKQLSELDNAPPPVREQRVREIDAREAPPETPADAAARTESIAKEMNTSGQELPRSLQGEAIRLIDAKVGDRVWTSGQAARGRKLKGIGTKGKDVGKTKTAFGEYEVVRKNKNTVTLKDEQGNLFRVPTSSTDFFGNVSYPRVRRLTARQMEERKRLQDGGTDRAGSNDIVELHSGFNPVEAVQSARDAIPPEVRNLYQQARKRFNTPAGKELVRKLEIELDPAINRRAGTIFERLRKAGFNDRTNKDFVRNGRLADILDGTELPTDAERPLVMAVRGTLMDAFTEAKGVGVRVSGYIKEYFPRMWKREIAEVVFDDILSAERKYAMLKEISPEIIPQVAERIEQLANSRGMADQTKGAILHLIGTGQAKNYAEAWQLLKRQVAEDLFEPFGNIERRRTLEFPKEYYERDAGKVLGQYFNSWAKRTSEVEVFGPKTEKANALLEEIRRLDPAEELVAKQVIDTFTGKLEKEQKLSRGMDRLVRLWTGAEVVTKIGFGFATLKNVFQTAISTAHEAGWARALTGIAKLVTPGEARTKATQFVRESGALNKIVWEALTGYRPLSKSGRISETVLKGSGFHGINVANQYIAGTVAMDFIPDLQRIARGEGALNRVSWIKEGRTKWAQNKLAEYGIDWRKPITDKQLKQAVFRFATDSQLQKNILRDPLAANHPKWRPLYLFKRFGMRQFNYIKDTAHANFKQAGGGGAGFAAAAVPLLRLAAGGAAGGALSMELEKSIRHLVSGEPPRVQDRDAVNYAIDALASIGAASVITDIVGAENKLRQAGFFVTPVQVQDAMNTAGAFMEFWNDMDADALLNIPPQKPIPTRPVPELLQARIKAVSKFTGSIPREFAKRLETADQREGRISDLKGKVRDDIFRALYRGERDKATRLRREWNRNYKDSNISPEDVSLEEYYRWKVRRGIRKQQPDVTGGMKPAFPVMAPPAPGGG